MFVKISMGGPVFHPGKQMAFQFTVYGICFHRRRLACMLTGSIQRSCFPILAAFECGQNDFRYFHKHSSSWFQSRAGVRLVPKGGHCVKKTIHDLCQGRVAYRVPSFIRVLRYRLRQNDIKLSVYVKMCAPKARHMGPLFCCRHSVSSPALYLQFTVV